MKWSKIHLKTWLKSAEGNLKQYVSRFINSINISTLIIRQCYSVQLAALTWSKRWHLRDDLEGRINFERACCNSATHTHTHTRARSSEQRLSWHLNPALKHMYKVVGGKGLPGVGWAYLSITISAAEEGRAAGRRSHLLYACSQSDRCLRAVCFMLWKLIRQLNLESGSPRQQCGHDQANRWFWNESFWINCPTFCSCWTTAHRFTWSCAHSLQSSALMQPNPLSFIYICI